MAKMFDSHAHYNSHKYKEENIDVDADGNISGLF